MELFYDNGCCTVYCGDCIEVMNTLVKQGKSVDKIITSPPYNTMRQTDDQGYDLYKDERINSEYIDWTIDVFNCYDKLLSQNGCVAYNMSYGTENTEVMNLTVAEIIKRTNFTLADILIWKKNSATPNNVSNNKMTRICEFVYIFCRRSEFFTFTSNKKVVSTSAKGQLIYENMFNYFSAPNNNESNSLNHATFSTEFVDEIIHRYVKKR